MTTKQPPKFTKFLPLPAYRGRRWRVFGGPYVEHMNMPGSFTVRLAPEIRLDADLVLPIHDFSVPEVDEAVEALQVVLTEIFSGHPVYVGCMAGRGRTGLFLALLAKCFGIAKPVEYVREHYYAHAVETESQYKFVTDFKVPTKLKVLVASGKFFSLFSFSKELTSLD